MISSRRVGGSLRRTLVPHHRSCVPPSPWRRSPSTRHQQGHRSQPWTGWRECWGSSSGGSLVPLWLTLEFYHGLGVCATPLGESVAVADVPGGDGDSRSGEGEGTTLSECLAVGGGSCLHLVVFGGVVCQDGGEVDLLAHGWSLWLSCSVYRVSGCPAPRFAPPSLLSHGPGSGRFAGSPQQSGRTLAEFQRSGQGGWCLPWWSRWLTLKLYQGRQGRQWFQAVAQTL